MVAKFNSASTELKTSAHASMDAASIEDKELTQNELDSISGGATITTTNGVVTSPVSRPRPQ